MPAAQAQSFVWSGPQTTGQLWSTPGNWLTNVAPTSGNTTQLTFISADSNALSANNDVAPIFDVNRIIITSASTSQLSVRNASNANQIRLTGANPTVVYNGGNTGAVATIGSTPYYGLVLAPTSGTTTIQGPGNGAVSLGGVNSGITGSGGITINLTGYAVANLNSPSAASGFANNFTGNVILNSGRFAPASTGLGAASNTLFINGGSLHTVAGGISLTNPIVLSTDLRVTSGTGVTISGPLSGSGGIQLLNGGIFTSIGLTIDTAASNTGLITIAQAAVRNVNLPTLTFTALGSMNGATAINIGQGGTLRFTGNSNDTRLPSVPVRIDGGGITLAGDNGTLLAETLGALTCTGISTFSVNPTLNSGPTTSSLTFASLTRTDNATLNFRGPWRVFSDGGRTGTLTFTSGLSGVNAAIADPLGPSDASNTAILPYASADPSYQNYGGGTAFVSYDAQGIRLISNNDPNVVQRVGVPLDAASDNRLVYASGTVDVSGTRRVNALALAGGAFSTSVLFTGTGTLSVYSGCLLIGGNNLLGPQVQFGNTSNPGPTLDFGSNTGYIHLGANTFIGNSSRITGSGGVVVSGAVTVATPILSFGAASLPSTFTGGLFINGATVAFNRDDQLGAADQPIVLNGGSLYFNLPNFGVFQLGRPIRLGPGGGQLFTVTGSVLEITTPITGTGGLSVVGASNAGTLKLSAANTFTGPVTIFSPQIVNVSSDANLGGSSEVRLAGGTLQAGTSATISKDLAFYSASSIDTNGFDLTCSGRLLLSSAVFRSLAKVGQGTLTLTASSPIWSGHIAVDSGVLALAGSGQLPQTLSIIANAGGEFRLDNSSTNLPDRIGDLTRVYLPDGGTFRFVGAPGAASSETFGGIALSDTATSPGNSGTGTIAVDAGSGGTAVLTCSGLITRSGTLVKTGSGVLQLSKPDGNDYTGGTIVQGGTLRASNTSGIATGVGTLSVAPTGTVDGTGIVGGPVTISQGAFITGGAGSGVGALAINGQLILNGTYSADVLNAAGDRLNITGDLNLGSASELALPSANQYVAGTTYTIATYTGALSGTFASVTGLTSSQYSINYGTGVNSAITITVTNTNTCRADFDGSGMIGVPDIFAFLSAWFAGDSRADIDGNGTIGVPDIFAFLSLWFAGC